MICSALALGGCGGVCEPGEPEPTELEWNDVDGLVVTTSETARVGVPVKIGETAPPCLIADFFLVNDAAVTVNTEYSPSPEIWTIVSSHTPGSDLPIGTTVAHRLANLDDPSVLVRPASAWAEVNGRIVARREW